ncbi:rhodanese-like domain-containing protein [Peribacillus simplex]|uniref:Rhodanese-like domain-containing protein n=1 Tax=Peribacillus simplex TaxID=1478 RepID=A0AAW7I7H9_9BACI|nr:rhodanese-like domain-containing protein [Peribacillus simplex]MDM5451066.1 rhodanese-like domain-containing protein [Peribacillus simplex]
MNRIEYFKARLEANMSPMEYRNAIKNFPEGYVLIDVRVGPNEMKKEKLQGALVMPLDQLPNRIDELPKEKTLVLYCWDTWCTLAAKAAILLLENGFNAKELYGGLAAWKTLGLPTEELGSNQNSLTSSVNCEC